MNVIVFFVKQKTAYEMRISDWSSDVCSSDLSAARLRHHISALHPAHKQTPLVIRSRPRHCSAAEAGSAAGWTRRDLTGMAGRRISRTMQPKVLPRQANPHCPSAGCAGNAEGGTHECGTDLTRTRILYPPPLAQIRNPQ